VTASVGGVVRKLGIVADDLTGAMDSSGFFAEKGFSTIVVLDLGVTRSEDVVVVSTDSRAEKPDVARARVRQAAGRLVGRMAYKKIDSTLRGNIGVELAAAMDELGCEKAVVAPAFPVVGRTTVDGVLLVNGTPVAETQFAQDPMWPVKESHIPTLLEGPMGRKVGCVSVAQVAAGPDALRRTMEGMPQPVVVCDVTQQSHLDTIALAVGLALGSDRGQAGVRWLACGSGGLARSLSLLLAARPDKKREAPSAASTGPALVVVGTRNQVAARQLLKAKESLGLAVLDLNVGRLDSAGASEEMARVGEEAGRHLSLGESVGVTTAFSEFLPGLKTLIPSALAEVVARVLRSHRPSGMLLSGGDIAFQVCAKLSVSAVRVYGEVEPGVPAGEVVGGVAQGMRVVTKAGGFGTDAALAKAISYIEKGSLP
jgi:uncharacterized protein YgbK (DUF1537 family)